MTYTDCTGQMYDLLEEGDDPLFGWTVGRWPGGELAPVYVSDAGRHIIPNHLNPEFDATEGNPAGDWIDAATGQRAYPVRYTRCRLVDSSTGEEIGSASVEQWWESSLASPEGHIAVDRNGFGTVVKEGAQGIGTVRICYVAGAPDLSEEL